MDALMIHLFFETEFYYAVTPLAGGHDETCGSCAPPEVDQ